MPLNIYAFNHYPKESVQDFLPDGQPEGSPFIFANTLGLANVHSILVFKHPGAGDFSPQSAHRKRAGGAAYFAVLTASRQLHGKPSRKAW